MFRKSLDFVRRALGLPAKRVPPAPRKPLARGSYQPPRREGQ
jgi:hypothetical protein